MTALISAPPSERERSAIYAHYGLTAPPRWATLRNFDNPTYGPKVARISAQLGFPYMPHQRYVMDTALEVNPLTGLPVYRNVGITLMRQTGKTTLILPLSCWRCQAFDSQQVIYAAQTGVAAVAKWTDVQIPILERAGWVPRKGQRLLPTHKARVRRNNGREAFLWRATRSVHSLQSNTEKSGHGPTLHLGLMDEFFAQVDNRVRAAWEPAQMAVADAQSMWFSTRGTSRSVPMNQAVTRGREIIEAGGPTRTAYFEWSRPEDADRADRQVWLDTIPALCPDPVCHCSPDWKHTIMLDTIQAMLESATTPALLADFDRGVGNIVREDDGPGTDPNVPTVEEWEALGNPALEGTGGSGPALAIDCTPSGDHAAIVAVGEGSQGPEGPPLLTVLDHGPGIEWVVPAAVRYQRDLRPVVWVLDEKSRAGELLGPLERAGIRRPRERADEQRRDGVRQQDAHEHARGDLWVPTVQEVGGASARMCSVVRNRELTHLKQKVIRDAVAGARTRPLGDGLFAFGRKASGMDICTLVAGSLALAGYERFRHLSVEDDYDLMDSIG
jgi:hypothetical protein